MPKAEPPMRPASFKFRMPARQQEVAAVSDRLGYEPVWKDWDAALTA